jgi:uncharacterized protein (DUF1697 family)
MPELKRALEKAGFTEVKTVISSGDVVFFSRVPGVADPSFMTVIEKTFGKEFTTRTWDTVGRIVKAGRA